MRVVYKQTYKLAKYRYLVSWLLLLAHVQGQQGNTGDLHHLEAATGNITLRFTSLTETRNQHFVVLINEVQATVSRNEASDLLSVLDQLHTDTLTNGRVRLLGLKTTVENKFRRYNKVK